MADGSEPAASNCSQFLQDLPARGGLASVQPGCAVVQRPASYLCTHDTAAPANQIIATDTYLPLFKCWNKDQSAAGRKGAGSSARKGEGSSKRTAATAAGAGDQDAAVKRRAAGPGSAAAPISAAFVQQARPAAGMANTAAAPSTAAPVPGSAPAAAPASAAAARLAAAVAAGPRMPGTAQPGSAAAAAADSARFSVPELKSKTIKELQDLLRRKGLPVSGKKEELVMRLMELQRRQQRAGRPS